MKITFEESLGRYADPTAFTEPIDIAGADASILKQQLFQMLLIRKAEEKIGDNVANGKIVCPCHLAIGQEAIPVGFAQHLRKTDRVFGTHRSHGHFLAMNDDVDSLMAEVLGKETGCSKGMGGSMHLYDEKNGFKGSVPIVGATISLAVGAGLAAKMDKPHGDMDVGVAYFGDGAAEEGTLHESLNFAERFKIPMIFICENNLFSSHLHIKLRQPADVVGRYAVAHMMKTMIVDGNDIVAVAKTAKEALDYARSGKGPVFVETITYRWRGHVGPSEDTDVGLARKDNLALWKKRDPVGRLVTSLKASGHLNDGEYADLQASVQAKVDQAWEKAEAAPFPKVENLLQMVYKD